VTSLIFFSLDRRRFFGDFQLKLTAKKSAIGIIIGELYFL